MGAMTNGGPHGRLQLVVRRVQHQNYTQDFLDCGHYVCDHDNRRPHKRRCATCAEEDARQAELWRATVGARVRSRFSPQSHVGIIEIAKYRGFDDQAVVRWDDGQQDVMWVENLIPVDAVLR